MYSPEDVDTCLNDKVFWNSIESEDSPQTQNIFVQSKLEEIERERVFKDQKKQDDKMIAEIKEASLDPKQNEIFIQQYIDQQT
mgnify:CR=1 FL=1|jgi:hypothetical protein